MDKLRAELEASGLDVFAPIKVSWYNDYLNQLGLATDSTKYLEKAGEAHASGEPAPFALAPLPDFGRRGDALGLIIGNSKAMWPCFLRWLKTKGNSLKDPVDTFAEEHIKAAVGGFAGACRYDIFWASDMSPERLVDMNRASLVSGLCYFSDEMFLSIHPKFGSWVAFRAVVVIDMPANDLGPAPAHLPPLLSEEEAAAARSAFSDALEASKEVDMSVDGMPLHLAKKWEKMRDCVSLGREHKYSALQSEYHYVKDPALLARALAEEV
jgi:methylmalonic aciduria homocystinuria type C protein